MKFTENTQTKYLAGLLLFLAFSLLAASWYVKEQQADYRSELQIKLAEQETRMAALSELADRDGVDAVVNQIISDCSLEDRGRFDYLLGSLSQLDRPELLEVQQLFKSCGGYYTVRKAITVTRLQREFEVYQEYLSLLELLNADTELLQKERDNWKLLVDSEAERSKLSRDLVTIQGDIIAELVAGAGLQSESITDMLKEAQTTKDSMLYLNETADRLRSSILGV